MDLVPARRIATTVWHYLEKYSIQIAISSLTAAVLVLCLILYGAYITSAPVLEPVTWEVRNIADEPLCVGDPLTFESITRFNLTATVIINVTILDENGNTIENVTPERLKGPANRVAGEAIPHSGEYRPVSVSVGIREPGVYEYRLFAVATGARTAALIIPFEVVDCGI